MDPMRPNFTNAPAQPNLGMGQKIHSTPITPPAPKKRTPKTALKKIAKWAVLVVILVTLGFLGLKYTQAQKEIKRLSNPEEVSKEETRRITNEVGRLIELPQGEAPTVATVVDASKIKDQPFFKSAENGDKVLIYTTARKAILYRPSTKKIIEVAPINIGDSSKPTDTTSPSPSQ